LFIDCSLISSLSILINLNLNQSRTHSHNQNQNQKCWYFSSFIIHLQISILIHIKRIKLTKREMDSGFQKCRFNQLKLWWWFENDSRKWEIIWIVSFSSLISVKSLGNLTSLRNVKYYSADGRRLNWMSRNESGMNNIWNQMTKQANKIEYDPKLIFSIRSIDQSIDQSIKQVK
jgi:hypothetical protein